MKEFRLFDLYDFLMDDDFIRWVKKGGKADNDFWNNWLEQNPEKHIIIAEAKKILESLQSNQQGISEEEKEVEIKRLLQTIGENTSEPAVATPVYPINLFKKWRTAVAVILVVALTGAISYFVFQPRSSTAQFNYRVSALSGGLIENVNTSGKPISLLLSDGSVVQLSSNSRIAYSNNFDTTATRDVYLSGEALFTVTKNPLKPFRVFANEIVTKVLGTSFIISSFEKDTVIQVTVKTGKVSVYSQSAVNAKETSSTYLGGIIVTPNQKLVYKRLSQQFEKNLLNNPELITADSVIEKEMLYEEAPLEQVFTQLSKIYEINIVYDNELVKRCTVTADLRNESFYKKLELICKAIGAQYEIIDGQVIIQTNGCIN